MSMMSKNQTHEKIRELVERYDEVVRDRKIHKFTEADVGSKFILPFLAPQIGCLFHCFQLL